MTVVQHRLVLSVAMLALVCSSCSCGRRHGGKTSPPDGYRSPYLSPNSSPGGVEERDTAIGAVASPTGPVSAVPEPVEERPRLHPAARERRYPLSDPDGLASNPDELRLLRDMEKPERGPATLQAIQRKRAEGMQTLRKALRSENRGARIQACLIYGNLGRTLGKQDIEALADAVLLDPDPDVRATAAKAFVAIRSREAVPALVRSLAEDPYAPARANAAWALGQIGGKGVVEVLRKSLRDEDTWVRLRSVTALGRLRAREAIPDLRALAADPNAMVRERVAEVLRSLGAR